MIVERHSVVDAPPQRVWARVVTPEGINDELRPWMTMSMPRGKEALTVELWPGRGFHEESTMLAMRLWRHERTLEPEDDAKTVVRDRLTFELRTPLRLLTPVVAAAIGALFAHRQRRLQRHFGRR